MNRSLRSKWASFSKMQMSDSTKKSFLEFQQETFLCPMLPIAIGVVYLSNQLLLEVGMMETKWLVCKMKRRPVQVVGVQVEEKTSSSG